MNVTDETNVNNNDCVDCPFQQSTMTGRTNVFRSCNIPYPLLLHTVLSRVDNKWPNGQS